jgi:hypothetical protein
LSVSCDNEARAYRLRELLPMHRLRRSLDGSAGKAGAA